MKTLKRGQILQRIYIEALVMGLCIGLAALLLNWWVGDSGWRSRALALIIVGGVLCVIQYGITRARGKR
ncbi:MAG: hypothetical protein HGA45_02775 [Chloroflexales bacterium]|nr:hypothetical protein [Chloroflexales bacterium]